MKKIDQIYERVRASGRGKMSKIVLLILLLALFYPARGCSLVELSAQPPSSPTNLNKIVMGYYPSWKRSEVDHTRIRYEYLTHIAHAFTKPDAQGNLVVSEDYLYPELVDEAHRLNVKVVMSVGGWGNCDGFPGMASTRQNRSRFIGQVLDFLRTNHYDGVDIDWEFVSNSVDQQNFTSFIKELSLALKVQKPPLLLTMAAPSNHYWGKWINYEVVARYFDFIGCMTYDYHGEWSDHSGHNSPLYSCGGDTCGSLHDSALYCLSRRIPKEKLLLGLAFFGRSFDCGGLYQKFQKSLFYGYVEVLDLLNAGWIPLWDDCAFVPYARKPDKEAIVCYDDARSISLKCRYVLAKKLAGVIIWEITLDDMEPGYPVLLDAVHKAYDRQRPLQEKKNRDRTK